MKDLSFSGNTIYAVLHAVVPGLQSIITDRDLGFPHFPAIDSLYNVEVELPALQTNSLFSIIRRLIRAISETRKDVLLFETPEFLESKYLKPIKTYIVQTLY